MKLHHLALTIRDASEIQPFYVDLLGFELLREFKLEADKANTIFNINKTCEAFYLEGHGLALELFIDENKKKADFNHWCLSFPDREAFIEKAEKQNARIIRIPRDSHDLLFIKDASENIFEIKEENRT